jgi:two-component system chemotaxis response regulator CheB
VDALFRTAARCYGPRVIGVILTGGLDDGTIGMSHIKEHGGIAIAQDPAEAVFPSMPASAIRNVEIDHVLPVSAIAAVVERLVSEPIAQGEIVMPRDRECRLDVAEGGQANLLAGTDPGPPTNLTCPECGGSLWELNEHRLVHYRCHVGHGYTADTLVEGKNSELEGALWGALRALEESAELRRRMAGRLRNAPAPLQDLRISYERQAAEAEARAAVLRTLLGNGATARTLAELTSAEDAAVASSRADPDLRKGGPTEARD